MKTIIFFLSTLIIGVQALAVPMNVQAANFGIAIEDSADTSKLGEGSVDLRERLEKKGANVSGLEGSAEGIKEFLVWIATSILIPIFVFIGLFLSILAFYKLMNADSDEDVSKASKFLLRGVIGIMIMVSAAYLVDQLVGVQTPGEGSGTVVSALIGGQNSYGGGALAAAVYEQLFFPFLRMFIYIILGVLFIFALINSFKLLFNADEQNEKQIITGITFSVIGIIIIIISKSVVELIYGKYSEIIKPITNLGEVGEGGFQAPEQKFVIFGTVLNRILGIVTFVIVILIIYQGFQLLTRPNDEETMANLKKNFGFIFLGIVVIGAAYLIANFLIFQTT